MIDPKAELTKYARHGSEAAFRSLVDHYSGLVFNSALRRVSDSSLAEETAQNVFAHLARKATQVSKYRSISAWLFETTRLESAKTLRTVHRHQRKLKALSETYPHSTMTDDLERELRDLLPHLEETLDSLKPGEYQILLARFFDNQSFPEIATSTGKSESACKMSLRRTLEKLRLKLTSRGITLSTITLGTLLQTEWARAAPTQLTATLTKTAMTAQPDGWASNFYSRIFTPKILTLVAVAFLGIACHQMIQSGSKHPAISSQASPGAGTPVTNSRTGVSRTRFSTQRKPITKLPKQTHRASDLKHFYLPLEDLKNISLEAAGKIIVAKYETICRETGESPLDLIWKVDAPGARIDFASIGSKSFENLNGHVAQGQHSLSLLHICQKLAIISGTRLTRKGTNFTFSQIKTGPTTSREFLTIPTFETSFRLFANKNHIMKSSPERISMRALTADFRKAGLLEDGETVLYTTSDSKLHVTAGARNMARINDLLDLFKQGMSVQIKYNLQFGSNGIFTDLPKLVTLPGQTATLKIGKEYLELSNDKATVPWVGYYLKITPEFYGLGERSTLDYSYIQEPSEKALAKYKESGRLDDLDLKEFRINQEVIIKSAEDRLGNFGTQFNDTDRDGNELSLLILSERVDAVGRPIMPE
ncbi:MAG: sigma-70 family RNA polymerase sigma factor [Akkermansiaceae bacterium]|nr:sigma-70 family RNA polymerase sigma factor [Akkermansiaceae bacterium]